VRLTVVGCSGSFPGPDSPASCYLVEHDGASILLDLGNGSLGPLQKYTDICAVDAVVISHLHVDHFIDLCSYHVARKYHPDGSAGPVPVYAPPGAGERVAGASGLSNVKSLADELDFRLLQSHIEVGPFTVEVNRMIHPVESYAIRVEAGGRSLTYSGDTGPCPELVTAAEGTNLALFESSFLTCGDNPPDLHLTAAEAGRHAHEAAAERLLLTHLVPWNSLDDVRSQAQAEFAHCDLAAPGMQIEI
jgi:ribonuclease BN (tRNA processing enzyme)